jgi:hypothetical protein
MAHIEGNWVGAINQASHIKGSIHDEARARELGFQHAVVGAGMHIPLVTKAAVELFGRDWYERGFLKARFGVPMHEGDEIRCVFEDLAPAASDERLLSLRIEKRDGATPMTGFLGLVKHADSRLAPWQRDGESPSVTRSSFDPLPADAIGSVSEPRSMSFEPEDLPILRRIGDPCPWYDAPSPWGPSILPTYRFVRLPRLASDLHPTPDGSADMASSMNALFQIVHMGPVLCDRDYTVQATLVEKGFSGRTAFRTSEAVISEGDHAVALVRQMLRWVPERAFKLSA